VLMPEPVRYRNKRPSPVSDWDDECRNVDTGGIGLDTDAQLCYEDY